MADRIPKRFDSLRADKRSTTLTERGADHHRDAPTCLSKILADRIQTGLQVQCIDRGLRKQQVRSSFY